MPDPLDRLADEATADYLRRSSITFLECAIHLMATHLTMEQIAQILEQEAQMLREGV